MSPFLPNTHKPNLDFHFVLPDGRLLKIIASRKVPLSLQNSCNDRNWRKQMQFVLTDQTQQQTVSVIGSKDGFLPLAH